MSIHKAIEANNKHLGCVNFTYDGKHIQSLTEISNYSTANLETILGDRLFEDKDLLENFAAANADTASSPKYYGFLSSEGSWYIMKEDTGSYTYVSGSVDYSDNWTDRVSLTYAAFNEVF